MTYKERLKMTHPQDVDDPEAIGGVVGCPSDHGWPDLSADECRCNDETCARCWNREIPGTEGDPRFVFGDKENGIAADNDGFYFYMSGRMITAIAKKEPKFDVQPEADPTPSIKDSGERRQFDTGAVRDIQEGKGRCDLMPLDVIGEITGDPVITRIADFVVTGDRGYLKLALDEFRGDDPFKDVPTMLLEVAKHFENGAKKYGENNWQKGIPVRCYIDSAVRHYLKYLRNDPDEPHGIAFCWNVICACWTCKHKPELNDYAPKPVARNEDTCVCCGATIPEGQQVCPNCLIHVKG